MKCAIVSNLSHFVLSIISYFFPLSNKSDSIFCCVFLFVSIVEAVVVPVADPGLRDAVPGPGARELEVRTGALLARVS